MKLMTLNTHSLVCDDGNASAKVLADLICRERIDLVALQEVNQPGNERIINTFNPKAVGFSLKNGNYMQKVLENLSKNSHNYTGMWYGFKESYGRLEEGVGIITRFPVNEAKTIILSSDKERQKWKKRCALGIKTPFGDFFSTHMGWWADNEEPFSEQWGRLASAVEGKKTWILGDFNSESIKTNEGYDMVISSGFYDTFRLAEQRDSGYTVCERIDGWNSRKNRRIDYIFCNFPAKIKYSGVICDGSKYPVISDHFGVIIEADA